MNLLKTLKNQVGSQLSNLESEIKAFAEKSKEGTLENADSSLQKGVFSAFGVLKNVLSKGVDTYKETVTRLDSSGSVTHAAKNALEKGAGVIKGVVANLNDSDSVASAAKNIFNKPIDPIREIKADVNSADSIAEAAKSTLNREKRDNQHTSASKTVEKDLDKVGNVVENTAKLDADNVVEETASGVAGVITSLETEAGSALDSTVGATENVLSSETKSLEPNTTELSTAATVKIETVTEPSRKTDAGAVSNVAGDSMNTVSETAEKIIDEAVDGAAKVEDDFSPTTTTISADTANATVVEDSNEIVNAVNNIADTDDLSPGFKRVDETVNKVVDQVSETPFAEKITTDTDSSSDRSTRTPGAKTIGSALAMGATTKTSQVKAKAKGSPATISEDSNSWKVNNSSGVDSRSFELDEFDDTVISGSDSYPDGSVSSPIAKVEKSKLNWVLLPMILVFALTVAWWLKFDPNGQFAEEVDFAVLEPIKTEPAEKSFVDVDTDADNSSSSSVAAENSVTTIEGNGLAGITEPAKGQVVDEALLAETKDSQIVAGISTNPDTETTPSAQIASDDLNSGVDSAIRAEQVAATEKARVVSGMSGDTIAGNSRVSSPVGAIATFLDSDSDLLPPAFTLHGLTFRIASSTITKDSRKIVYDLATTLKTHPTTVIRLEGHTDNRGRPDSNRALSASRARAVRTVLVNLNLDPTRITAQGLGANHPVADNDTKAGRLKNRRVDVIITER